MASVRSQRPDALAESQALAASAVNVPQLRDAVVKLTEAVERLEMEVARLREEARRGR